MATNPGKNLSFFPTVFRGLLDFISNGFVYLGLFWNILYDKPNGKIGQYPSIARFLIVTIFLAAICKWIQLEGGFLEIMVITLVYLLAGKTVVPLSQGVGMKSICTRVMSAIDSALGNKCKTDGDGDEESSNVEEVET